MTGSTISAALKTLLALPFPGYCPNCHREWEGSPFYICDDCWSRLTVPRPGLWQGEPELRGRVFAAVSYSGLGRELVHRMKFLGVPDIALRLGVVTAERWESKFGTAGVDAVVPVPLHPVRVRERGFDQNRILAGVVAERLGKPLLERLIIRVRNTPPQSRLSDAERRQNLQGAFACLNEGGDGEQLLLVDDVIHTGATALGCIAALEAAGAKRVRVIAACG